MATSLRDIDDDLLDDTDTDSAVAVDAMELLQADHDEVKQMFEEYEGLMADEAGEDERQELATRICNALTVHATIEEEILYPAARGVPACERLVDEATVEHASAKALILEIESMSPSMPLFDAKVAVLGEYVSHHIDEEEEELLPQLANAGIDLDELGEELQDRKLELMEELGMEGES